MELKHSIKCVGITIFGLVALLSMTAVAQEIRSEISVQGTGFFTKNSQGNGVRNQAEETGGFLLGYRYNINRWLAAEANYGYDRDTQSYFGSTLAIRRHSPQQLDAPVIFIQFAHEALRQGFRAGFDELDQFESEHKVPPDGNVFRGAGCMYRQPGPSTTLTASCASQPGRVSGPSVLLHRPGRNYL